MREIYYMRNLIQVFEQEFNAALENSDPDLYSVTTVENVLQVAQLQNRKYFESMLQTLIQDGSRIIHLESLEKLHSLAKNSNSALILGAHFTNFDVPALYTLLKAEGAKYEQIFDDIIFIAGRKLTEGTKYVKAMAEMFTRLVISAKSDNMTKEEIQKALAINKASQKKLAAIKKAGHIFFLYPTGTRSRPGAPETCRGMREIFNYIKKFDYICINGMKGNVLPARDDVLMEHEFPRKDVVELTFSEVYRTDEYIARVTEGAGPDADLKQIVVDAVVDEIYSLGDDPRKWVEESLLKTGTFA